MKRVVDAVLDFVAIHAWRLEALAVAFVVVGWFVVIWIVSKYGG